jgi:hypothetical protein
LTALEQRSLTAQKEQTWKVCLRAATCPRFLIADDHTMFAETLRVYLEKTYTVVGVVLDGRTMVAEAMRLLPDEPPVSRYRQQTWVALP